MFGCTAFGVKLTALQSPIVRRLLFSADSMAWSFAAMKVAHRSIRHLKKRLGRPVKPAEARRLMALEGVAVPDPNDWREAKAFADQVAAAGRGAEQLRLPLRVA